MTDDLNPTNHSTSDGSPSMDDRATCFAEVTSGIYRRVDVDSVWKAIQYAVEHQLPAENPTIMMMMIRIAEVYPQVREDLVARQSQANEAERLALELILDPPEGLREAEYLPDEIGSPGEMDLCWSEFLVTGSMKPIEKVVAVLDRDDLTRPFLDALLVGDKTMVGGNTQLAEAMPLSVGDAELAELASIGVALGMDAGHWKVVSPGDLDILFWFGVKDQKPTCTRIFSLMTEEHRVHVANKGAAMWSLQANASQHGKIRLFCEEQAKIDGGRGRLLINPTAS